MHFSVSRTLKDPVSEELWGLFFEDINFAADGGLYAELLENRNFEAKKACGIVGAFYTEDDFGYAWSPVFTEGQKEPRMQFISGRPLSTINPHYLRFTSAEAGQGFANKAFDGIHLVKGEDYKVSFYARCVNYEGNHVTAEVVKDGECFGTTAFEVTHTFRYYPFMDTLAELPEGVVSEEAAAEAAKDDGTRVHQDDWIYYEGILHAEEEVRHGVFRILLEEAGTMEFDMVSMMPCNAVEGVFRRDLFEALDAMHPGFIRFPGGCIVEGIGLDNSYRWKNTIGPLKDRRVIPNLWSFNDDRTLKDPDFTREDCHYMQSYGLGFYEYFLLCEKLGAKALPVLNIGAACQFRSNEKEDVDDPAFREYLEDAIHLIEFANGSVKSRYGGIRAAMGHPEPFHLEMIAIGNEQWETKYFDLKERYRRFANMIRICAPEMKLVGTAGPNVNLPLADELWEYYRSKETNEPTFCNAVDEHYYVSPEWLYEHVDMYDSYPRKVGVFAGEYAAHTENRENSMEAALAEAAFLTGVEKNAGVVKLASYAPLFNRIGHSQWKPDMIWFDDARVYLTPNYYVQKLFARNNGEYTVDMEGQEKIHRRHGIYVSLTATQEEYILKAVNTTDQEDTLILEDEKGQPYPDVPYTVEVLHSCAIEGIELDGELPEPSEVVTKSGSLGEGVALEAKSVTVLRFPK